MTQEEKAKAYDEALALMQNCIQDENGLVHVRPDEIFHELKIGDEWIRKALLKMVHDTEDIDLWIDYDVHKEEALAWLKKQSKVEQAMREVEEKAEAFTQAHKGETSDEILAQMRGEGWSEDDSEDERIRETLIELITWASSYSASGITTDEAKEMIAWLEKQGETYTKEDVDDAYIKGMAFAKDELEKQNKQILANSAKTCKDEQKPADKVEPKFKVGDWVVNKGHSYLIADIDFPDNIYLFEIGGYTHEQLNGEYIENADKKYHLWTIADAKDGDVLVNGDEIVIFKKNSFNEKDLSGCMFVHCSLRDKKGSWYTIGGINPSNYLPATKAQRDKLFKAMKEVGYVWNMEKKELKKINSYCQEHCKGYQETGKCYADGECEAKKNADSCWSEEDEEMLDGIILRCEKYGYQEQINWLKSLKDRYTWKPSDEQMEALKCVIADIAKFSKRYGRQVELENEPYYSALHSLYEQLKKLKGE